MQKCNLNVAFFQSFFADLGKWEEKCKMLNESGNFLIEVVREPIAADIKNKVHQLKSCKMLKTENLSVHFP